jgi:primary-amine oxidase
MSKRHDSTTVEVSGLAWRAAERFFHLAVPALFAVLTACAAAPASAQHPLDSLTSDELRTTVRTLRAGGLADEATLFHTIVLDLPPKPDVLAWRPGGRLHRRAFVVARRGRRTFEGHVDLSTATVLSWTERTGIQPSLLPSEEAEAAIRTVYANPEWQSAVAGRGIRDTSHVTCVPLSTGGITAPEHSGSRLVNVVCYAGRAESHFWGHPIEGLVAVVDLDAHRVVKVLDNHGPPLRPAAQRRLPDRAQGAAAPTPLPSSPSPSRIQMEGRVIRWDRWQFHVRHDPRVGVVVSTVSVEDGGQRRSLMYEGSLSEIFVPYMDPEDGWAFRTFLDAGENEIGKLTVSLSPGLDCPATATFVDAVMADDSGEPIARPRAMCLFERHADQVAWRHSPTVEGPSSVQARTDLVVREVAAVGNYDYVFDWIFRQDGSIGVAVGATGVMQVKAVGQDAAGTAFGRLIDDQTVAVNHDHFFAFRLDLDVDGTQNSFTVDRLLSQDLPHHGHRRSIWTVHSEVAPRESDAQLHTDMAHPALWRVVSPVRRDRLGNESSYHISPGHEAVSLLRPDDPAQGRAGFTRFNLWVTPYVAGERYAAGDYPNQRATPDGLPLWTSADRPIQATDIVLWYTMGFHHVPRVEDWPIVPTMWHQFDLRPFNFFSREANAGKE